MDIKEKALQKHYEWGGKLEVISRAPINTREDLSLAYTPGVAQPCLEIAKDPELSYKLTRRSNLVAVITDGTAVLGLGDIGGLAGMPVMEGKCCLFKEFGGVDAFPLCIKSKDPDEIVRTIELISDSFGGINLEDISAPRCFEIEAKLKEKLDIPVFHDDQHGTAIVVGAAMLNAVKLAGKKLEDVTVVINGAGSAGIAIGKFLLKLGVGNLVMVDLCGILNRDDHYDNPAHAEMAQMSNKKNIKGGDKTHYTHVELRKGRHTSSSPYRDIVLTSDCPYAVMQQALGVVESGRQPITAAAVTQAQRIQTAAVQKGYRLFAVSPTNQVFLVLSHAQIERLRQDFAFEITGHVDDEHEAGRFVCSWATKEEAVDALIAAL